MQARCCFSRPVSPWTERAVGSIGSAAGDSSSSMVAMKPRLLEQSCLLRARCRRLCYRCVDHRAPSKSRGSQLSSCHAPKQPTPPAYRYSPALPSSQQRCSGCLLSCLATPPAAIAPALSGVVDDSWSSAALHCQRRQPHPRPRRWLREEDGLVTPGVNFARCPRPWPVRSQVRQSAHADSLAVGSVSKRAMRTRPGQGRRPIEIL